LASGCPLYFFQEACGAYLPTCHPALKRNRLYLRGILKVRQLKKNGKYARGRGERFGKKWLTLLLFFTGCVPLYFFAEPLPTARACSSGFF